MKFKAVVVGPDDNIIVGDLMQKLGSLDFATEVLQKVADKKLGFGNPLDRPAEAYLQLPDRGMSKEIGVVMNLTGVSRDGREPKQFHEALQVLHDSTVSVIQEVMNRLEFTCGVQAWTTIMLDGPIPIDKDSGQYSSILESRAEWV
jgi:hypothetical protein